MISRLTTTFRCELLMVDCSVLFLNRYFTLDRWNLVIFDHLSYNLYNISKRSLVLEMKIVRDLKGQANSNNRNYIFHFDVYSTAAIHISFDVLRCCIVSLDSILRSIELLLIVLWHVTFWSDGYLNMRYQSWIVMLNQPITWYFCSNSFLGLIFRYSRMKVLAIIWVIQKK